MSEPASPSGPPAGVAGRYLFYAIGEITLVFIGILLALQINNWDENRKTINKTQKYRLKLIAELKAWVAKSKKRLRKQ